MQERNRILQGDEELAYCADKRQRKIPCSTGLAGEMKQRLADAIEELPEKERLVLTLYYFEELSMKEIGLTPAGRGRIAACRFGRRRL